MEYKNTNLSNELVAPSLRHEQIDTKQLWENTLVDIELNISKANFSTWFQDTRIIKIDGGIITINVPNEFVKDWLSNKFHTLILKTLRGFSSTIRGIEYVIKKDTTKQSGGDSSSPGTEINGELPLHNYYINKNSANGDFFK